MKVNGRKIAVQVTAVLVVLGMLVGIMGVVAQHTASAANNSVFVHHVADGPLWLHPHDATIHSQVTDLMPTGTEFDIQCFSTGDNVSGDVVWDYGTNRTTGHTGYAADKYLDTKDTQGHEPAQLSAQGIPQCGTQATSIPNPMYNRSAAVAWALAHAQDPQTNGELCTKFVSEALWAGGLPQTSQWNNNGGYRSGVTWFDGTQTANIVKSFLDYIRAHYSNAWIALGKMSSSNNNVPAAEIGDIIAYDWDGNGTIDHLAFIVGAAQGNPQYPLVAEWGQFADYGIIDTLHNPRSPYVERGWTWSEINHMYLQQEKSNHNMTAYLLHFNGGYIGPSY